MTQTTSVSTASPTIGKGSPDSFPSIATTSVTSSEGESDDPMSPRVLFKHSNNDVTKEVVENIQTVIESKNSMIEKKTGGAAALSISSSASTEVATWNLSQSTVNGPDQKNVKPAATRTICKAGVSTVDSSDDDGDEETVDGSIGAFPTSEMRKLNKKDVNNAAKASKLASIPSIAPLKKPLIIMEDPPKDTISCNRAAMSMTPKQLTEIFNSFDGNKTIWSMREQYSSEDPNDEDKEDPSASPTSIAAETVRSTAARWMDGWMPQNENLEREHEALKEVLEDNSNKMLNLREAVETQRALNALKEVEIEDKEKELQAMRTELEDLSHQKELFVEREQELLETIEELTDRVDDLIERNCNSENPTESALRGFDPNAELEPFDESKAGSSFGTEPEPFDEAEDRAAIIRRQESLISGLRNTMKAKDKEIYLLKERMDQALTKRSIQELQMRDSGAALKAKDAEILSLQARLEVASAKDKEIYLLKERMEQAFTKNAIYDLQMKDSSVALKAKDGEILSLKARLEVALEENAKTVADKIASLDLAVSETVEEKESLSASEKDESPKASSNNESEATVGETLDEESTDNENLKSTFDQENAPPSPPAPTGVVAELRKKLETKGSEPRKPSASTTFPSDGASELLRPLEQSGASSTARGRSPTPVSECSTEGEETAITPNPIPPTPQASPVAKEELLSVIANLSKRINAVESESRGSSCSDRSCKASCEISIVVVKGQESDDPRRIDFEEEEYPGTIEVMLEGQKYGDLDARRHHTGEKAALDEEDKDSCCCWSVAVTGDLE